MSAVLETTKPVTPGITVSGEPPESPASTGRPVADASRYTSPSPSTSHAARPSDDLSHLRTALSNPAPLATKPWQAFYERFGVKLIERYGLTETVIVSTNPPGNPRPGSVGRALKDTDVSLYDNGVYGGQAGDRGDMDLGMT